MATSSDTELCNLALSHIGTAKTISNLETDKDIEAKVCRLFIEVAREATLRDFAWTFATNIATLNLVESDPTTTWLYSYRYPSDCLMVRRIFSGVENDTRQSRSVYKVLRDASGLLIYSNKEDAILEYTFKEDDPTRYPADFELAFSYRLAALMANRLTKGDPFKMKAEMISLYEAEISRAKASGADEEQRPENPESEFIRARESDSSFLGTDEVN